LISFLCLPSEECESSVSGYRSWSASASAYRSCPYEVSAMSWCAFTEEQKGRPQTAGTLDWSLKSSQKLADCEVSRARATRPLVLLSKMGPHIAHRSMHWRPRPCVANLQAKGGCLYALAQFYIMQPWLPFRYFSRQPTLFRSG